MNEETSTPFYDTPARLWFRALYKIERIRYWRERQEDAGYGAPTADRMEQELAALLVYMDVRLGVQLDHFTKTGILAGGQQ